MKIITDNIELQLNEKLGTFDILRRSSGKIIVKNAHCAALTGDKKKYCTSGTKFTKSQGTYRGYLGKGTNTRLDFQERLGGFHFQLEIVQYDNFDFITLEAILTNESKKPQEIQYLSPLEVLASKKGGIALTKDPQSSVIFENGLGFAFEFFMRSFNAREESESSMMEFVYDKNNFSNNLLLGILSLPQYLSEVISNDEEEKGIQIGNKEAIAELRMQSYFPFPKLITPGTSISSGTWIVQLDEPSPFEALENYANLIAQYNNINLWPHEIPHGWNSWNNPVDAFRNYSYVTQINEEIILDNMKIAVDKLKPFGLKYWQLDNGYSKDDLMNLDDIMEDRFPHGMKHLADMFREQGLIPGIWINPFSVGINSKIFKEKEPEGWFPEPDDSFPIKSKTWRPIDLTIPDAQNYFRRAIRRVVKEWGYKLLKVDFAYMSMAPIKFHNEVMTSPEVHRLGWELIRKEAGEDVFIFGIGGPMGLHYGIIDGERITLDTLPKWHPDNMPIEMLDIPQTGGSVFYNYRTMARRYYYNNRIWFNHLDCFSFRPSIARNEAMMLITAMGMLGGIWKIGDKLKDLQEDDFEIIRKFLPIHRNRVRPIDLFQKLIPEVLHFPCRLGVGNNKQNVVALMNWGPNKDLITEEQIPSKCKKISVKFGEIGLKPSARYHVFDFWKEKYLGCHKQDFGAELKPRHQKVLSIRKNTKKPTFLSVNRHITQGQQTISLLQEFKKHNNQITLEGDLIAEYKYKFYFYVPNDYEFVNINNYPLEKPINLEAMMEGRILKISAVVGTKSKSQSQRFIINIDFIEK